MTTKHQSSPHPLPILQACSWKWQARRAGADTCLLPTLMCALGPCGLSWMSHIREESLCQDTSSSGLLSPSSPACFHD